jgi:hypothetical protein
MTFQTGNNYSGGRPPGAVNKRSEELRRRLQARGDKDPADFLSAVVTNEQEPKELRVQAANMLLPYLYSKRGATAEPPARIFIEHEVVLPHAEPRTITQSNENILFLSRAKASAQIDQEWGDNLIADQCRVRDGLIDDAKLLAVGRDFADQHITITGGLPELPGTEVIMPQLNGHTIDHVQIETKPNDSTDSGRSKAPDTGQAQ